MSVTKLRFIKDWGPYKKGQLHYTLSPTTVHYLVDVYKVAKVEADKKKTRKTPEKTKTQDEVSEYEFVYFTPEDDEPQGVMGDLWEEYSEEIKEIENGSRNIRTN